MSMDQMNSNAKRAQEKLMRLLALRDHSRFELVQKLKQKKFLITEIDQALHWAKDHGFLPDETAYAARLNNELKSRGKGQSYRRDYLAKRGLLAPPHDENEELQAALEFIAKKSNDIERAKNQKEKCARLLTNRGFSPSTIRQVIHEKF